MVRSVGEVAREVFTLEGEAILEMRERLVDADFERATSLVLQSTGRLVITGMGKSGLIGRKIAATLASTGTRSFFLHPGEAYHGDLGMLAKEDVVVGISYSGETEELVRIVPFLVDHAIPLIAITGNAHSTLARYASVHLDASIEKEACPLQLAPTTSTTVALALGDALAVALMEERNFQSEDFARYHPGGSLGKRLLTRVRDVMRSENLPEVDPNTTLVDLLHTVSAGRVGACVVRDGEEVVGIVTDGDLRRVLEAEGKDALDLTAGKVMTAAPLAIKPDEKVETAVQLMNDRNVTVLLVRDEQFQGIVHLFDCGL